MSTPTRKEWQPRIRLGEALSIGVDWLERSRQKNSISKLPCSLYTAYAIPELVPLGLSQEASRLFRFSNREDPDVARLRDSTLRLLGVAMKAHHFLAPEHLVRHEPFVSSYPDPLNPGSTSVCLIYRLEGDGSPQTIVVATSDLAFGLQLPQGTTKFPVALSANPYKWMERRRWEAISEENSPFNKSDPEEAKREKAAADKWRDASSFPFGTVLSFPYETKDLLKLVGARWAPGIQKWYLPKGYDLESVNEWGEFLSSELRSGGVEKLERLFFRELGGKKIETWSQRTQRQSQQTS